MIDFNAVRVSLQEWVVRSSGLPDNKVVFEDQTAPRPEKPYISIKISTTIDIGQEDARGPIDDNGDAEFIGNREFTLSIKSYGDDALNTLSLIRDSLNSPTELQTLRDNSVVFVDQLLFTDVNELLETIWEERGQLDLLMRTISTSTHQVGIIDRVIIDSEYQDKGATEILVEGVVVVSDPDALGGDILEVSPAFMPMVSPGPNIAGDEVTVNDSSMSIISSSPVIVIAPSNELISWNELVNVTIGPGLDVNKITSNGWDGGAYSSGFFTGNGYVEFDAPPTTTGHSVMLGISDEPNGGSGHADIDFAMFVQATGTEFGVLSKDIGGVITGIGLWSPGSKLRVEIIGSTVHFKVNGGTVSTEPIGSLGVNRHADCVLFDIGSIIIDPILLST